MPWWQCYGGFLVGGGTVPSAEAVKDVADAGGRLIVGPNSNSAVISAAEQAGCHALPGGADPTRSDEGLTRGAPARNVVFARRRYHTRQYFRLLGSAFCAKANLVVYATTCEKPIRQQSRLCYEICYLERRRSTDRPGKLRKMVPPHGLEPRTL